MKDNFSAQATDYAKYRPGYPPQLFDFIQEQVSDKDLAWDCGTGNGQAAKFLSKYFNKVIATDISQQQLDNAWQSENIFYSIANEENASLKDNSVDLITVAQAIHWFDFDKFYKEVNRVAKKDAVVAIWTYSRLKISDEIEPIISDYHSNFLKDYWDPERKYVDDHYVNIPFPFTEIVTPDFSFELKWTLENLEGYLNTWSALQKFIKTNNHNPVPELIEKIKPYWNEHEAKTIVFPIHLRLGLIRS